MNATSPLDGFIRAVQRAEAPYVLFPDDISVQLGLKVDVAREAIRRGRLGPWFLVDGEPAVLRDTMRAHLVDRGAGRSDRGREVLLGGANCKEARDGVS